VAIAGHIIRVGNGCDGCSLLLSVTFCGMWLLHYRRWTGNGVWASGSMRERMGGMSIGMSMSMYLQTFRGVKMEYKTLKAESGERRLGGCRPSNPEYEMVVSLSLKRRKGVSH
jgi:hypothetical protein